MKGKFLVLGGMVLGLALAAVMVFVGLAAPAAFAQGPVGTPAPRGPGYGGMMGGGFGGMMGGAYGPMMGGNFGGPANSLIAVAAKTIGIEQADLIKALNDGQLPTELSQLKPYFESPVDDAVLERYRLLQTGKLNELPSEAMLVGERAVVDERIDCLYSIGLNQCTVKFFLGPGLRGGPSGEMVKHIPGIPIRAAFQ